MPNKIYLPVLIVFLCISSSAQAELIKLKSGQSVEGKIITQDKDKILVDIGIDTPVTYFRDEIKEIAAPAVIEETIQDPQAHLNADAMEAKAVELIDAGQMDQGLEAMRQAIALDATPQRHFNYGSILFGNGVSRFKKGMIEEAKKILLKAQDELDKAISGFDPENDTSVIAQAYFLSGEIQSKAFDDTAKAKVYYQKAISAADHDGAKAALTTLK